MNRFDRLVASVRTRGWWRTALLVPAKAGAHLSKVRDRSFDLRRGINTRGVIELADLDVIGGNKERGIRYEPTRARPFEALLARVRPPRHGTFVDFGSGMGRVLLMAFDYGFAKVVGVEFSARLCRIAGENVNRYAGRDGEHVVIVHGDATEYVVRSDERVFYFFNPFDAGLLQIVRDNILASCTTAPREIYVIYHNPVWRQVFDNSEQLELHAEHHFHDCHFVVYRGALD